MKQALGNNWTSLNIAEQEADGARRCLRQSDRRWTGTLDQTGWGSCAMTTAAAFVTPRFANRACARDLGTPARRAGVSGNLLTGRPTPFVR
jgi:hypothetical protein